MPKKKKEKEVGVITHYFGKINVGVVKITSGSLKVGDKIHIKGATTDFEQEVKSLQVDHQDVSEVKKGEEAGMKVDDRVREEDKVFKIVE
ncbi:hypothetical protein J7K05_02155 [bacterium]|nr:hypothetical protein [bacterium]